MEVAVVDIGEFQRLNTGTRIDQKKMVLNIPKFARKCVQIHFSFFTLLSQFFFLLFIASLLAFEFWRR